MPGPMPYYLEKGPALSLIESFLNDGDNGRVLEALRRLRARTLQNGTMDWEYRVSDCCVFDTASFDMVRDGTTWNAQTWKDHLDGHWFGLAGKGPQWWLNYTGDDVEGIVRETLVRAIEIAFGLAHDQLPGPRATHWPIELFWKCGQAWFEGWVTWRRLPGPGDNGLVTVLLCTPAEVIAGSESTVWRSPLAPEGDRTDPYAENPASLGSERQGMVVITHKTHVDVSPTTGNLTPTPLYRTIRGTDEVVVVRPSEIRGGVASTPRSWTPE